MKRSVVIALIAALGAATLGLALSGEPARELSILPPTEVGESGSPADPADYLTLKWTSGQDVTPAMVERAKRQAARLIPPSTSR